MSLSHCQLITLPEFSDERGKLTYMEQNNQVPFEFKRVYCLYQNNMETVRGEHAHKELKQLVIATHGGFNITLDDGRHTQDFRLDRPNIGLYICPMIWRKLYNFSPGTVCMVLASEYYQESDYYRDYNEFIASI